MKKDQKGQSLIEVLTAVFVMSITLIGSTLLIVNSIKANHSSFERATAINIAQGNLDAVRNIRDSVWINPEDNNGYDCNIPGGTVFKSSFVFLHCFMEKQIGLNISTFSAQTKRNKVLRNFSVVSSKNYWKLEDGSDFDTIDGDKYYYSTVPVNNINYKAYLVFEVYAPPPDPLCTIDTLSFVKVTSFVRWNNNQNATEKYTEYLTNWNIGIDEIKAIKQTGVATGC